MLKEHMSPQIDIGYTQSTDRALLKSVLSSYVLVQLDLSWKLFTTFRACLLVVEMLILEVLVIVSLGSFPTTNITNLSFGITFCSVICIMCHVDVLPQNFWLMEFLSTYITYVFWFPMHSLMFFQLRLLTKTLVTHGAIKLLVHVNRLNMVFQCLFFEERHLTKLTFEGHA